LPGAHDIAFGQDGRAAIAVTGAGAVFVFNNINASTLMPADFLVAPRAEGVLIHSNGQIYAMASGIGGLIAYRDSEIVATASGHPGAHDVAEDQDGNIWVADNMNRRLVKYAPDLTRLQVLNHEKFGFIGPRYMDIDEFGRIIVADQDGHRVLMINPEGPDGRSLIGVLGTGSPGKGPNLFDDLEGVAVDGSVYYISDSDNNRVVRYVVVTN
jgi:sugar lactone lactonase YvrE